MSARSRRGKVPPRHRSIPASSPGDLADNEFLAWVVAGLPDGGAENVAFLERVKAVYVECGRDDHVRDALQRWFSMIWSARNGQRDEGGCFFVTGESGAGKTMLARHALSRFPRLQPRRTSFGETCPVVSISLTGPCILKTLGVMILKGAGYSFERDFEENQLWEMLPHQLHLRQVLLVHIDETQHMLRATAKDSKRKAVANAIKGVMNYRPWPVSFILSGLPETTELIRDPQIERRHTQLHLSDVLIPDERDLVENLVVKLAEPVGIRVERLLASDVPERIAHSANYQYGRIAQVVVAGLQKAFARGHGELTRRHFASAFLDRSHARGRDEMNPFLAADWHRLAPGSFILRREGRA